MIRTPKAVLALLLFLLTLVSGLAALLAWQRHQDAIAEAGARAESSAHVVTAHVQWIVEAGYQTLRRVDDILAQNQSTLFAEGVAKLEAAAALLPEEVQIAIFDRDGALVLTNASGIDQASVIDQEYFQHLSAGQEWHMTRMLPSPFGDRMAFAIGRRLESEGGFAGIALLIVPMTVMSEFWEALNLGGGSTVGLIRDDGWLVARYPVPGNPVNMKDYVLFTEHLAKASSGSYMSPRSPADGIGRIVGFRRVPGAGLIAVAGIPEDVVLGPLWTSLGVAASIAAPSVLALFLVSLWLVSLLRRDETTRNQLTAAVEENRLLLAEVHHRVKNNLQTVSALVSLQPGSPEAKAEMTRRIAAMTAVHEHIYLSDQFGRMEFGGYLRRLVEGIQTSYGKEVAIDWQTVPVQVHTDQALPIGLIVNEVVSNAFKHAFPDGRKGRLTVKLEPISGNQGLIRIRDDGVGFDTAAVQTGLGNRLIAGLANQIGANYTFEASRPTGSSGTTFTLAFPT